VALFYIAGVFEKGLYVLLLVVALRYDNDFGWRTLPQRFGRCFE
jgi:hypothetical protein